MSNTKMALHNKTYPRSTRKLKENNKLGTFNFYPVEILVKIKK